MSTKACACGEVPQADLFGAPAPIAAPPRAGGPIQPAEPGAEVAALAARLTARHGGRLYLGTSSWHFPGWQGLVWAGRHAEAELSRDGLAAYARHPLLRTVSLDRAFYRPLDVTTCRRLATQAGTAFRFVVKAPAVVSDATVRDAGSGRALQANPLFLDPRAALDLAVAPVAEGLGSALGALVFQLSPLPRRWLEDLPALHQRLTALFDAVVPALPADARLALELRDPPLLTPELAALLRRHGVRYCLGLHDRMPDAQAQLPMLRATWPGDLVCRWNLQRGQRYADARDRWAPFDRMRSPDSQTRATLAKVVHGTLSAGHRAFVTVNNKAEGSAPHSVIELARAIDALDHHGDDPCRA